jgi:cytochrome c
MPDGGLGVRRLALAAALLLTASPVLADPPAGDPAHGEKLYRSRCGACHALDRNKTGPRHRGVFGRPVATVPDFRYSRALAGQSFVWDADRLDAWLADPKRFAPGTSMGARTPSPQDRADLIAYLRGHP